MASIWRLNEDRVEFERVTSAVLDADPDGTYVIQQPDNTFRLRIGNAPLSQSASGSPWRASSSTPPRSSVCISQIAYSHSYQPIKSTKQCNSKSRST